MPAGARDETEAVARGFRGVDAPARRRSACFERRRRPQQEKRYAGGKRGKMQPLAQFEIELVDAGGDRLRPR